MIETQQVCTKDGKDVCVYTFTNDAHGIMSVTNYGATIMSVLMPDVNGNIADVVLGFSTPQEYFGEHPFFGATVGRVANRIAQGKFMVGGKEYSIPCNEKGVNLLHSGNDSFNRKVWEGTVHENTVHLTYHSPDGENGFPGAVDVRVEMTLTEENAVRLEYFAHSDADTLLSLTNHSYFNLRGEGEIYDHILSIGAGEYTPVDENLIPTGEIAEVAGTPLDFTHPHLIGERIEDECEQLKLCGGYDHNFVLWGMGFRAAARVEDPQSGRVMEVYTDEPGMQLYTANFVSEMEGKHGVKYGPRTAYCFETQLFPDSIHHDNFPSCVLHEGRTYHNVTEYRFFVK
ncbi:MAG: aldose epimerase family protein [Christensenella sp.]